MSYKKALLSFLVFFLLTGFFCIPAYSYYYDAIDKVKFQGYNGEGSFVEGPAYCGDVFGYVLGLPLACVISEPVRIANYNEESDNIGVATLKCTTKPMGLFFGGLPYLFKKAFWDFPIWICGGDISEPSPYDYKPTPVADVEVPPELIEKPRIKLNEQSATAATPKLTEIKEPVSASTKVELPPVTAQTSSDAQKISQPLPVSTAPSESSNVKIPPASSSATGSDQTPKSSSQSWEQTNNIPTWLSEDLAK